MKRNLCVFLEKFPAWLNYKSFYFRRNFRYRDIRESVSLNRTILSSLTAQSITNYVS